MGFDSGYVSPLRKLYSRRPGQRESGWSAQRN
jgi:hypothetical protein